MTESHWSLVDGHLVTDPEHETTDPPKRRRATAPLWTLGIFVLVFIVAFISLLYFSVNTRTGPWPEYAYRSVGLFSGNTGWGFERVEAAAPADIYKHGNALFRALAVLAPFLTALGLVELTTGPYRPLGDLCPGFSAAPSGRRARRRRRGRAATHSVSSNGWPGGGGSWCRFKIVTRRGNRCFHLIFRNLWLRSHLFPLAKIPSYRQNNPLAGQPAMAEIFVSYASADQAIADRLVQALENRKLTCWIASRDIPLGSNYQNEIPGAIAGCHVFLLLHSRHAAKSRQILKEVSLAQDAGKPFIPLRLDESKPEGGFLYELTTAQYLDMFPDFDVALHRLSLQLAQRGAHPAEVERRARNLAALRAVRMWSFRAALVVVACLGTVLVWKAAPALHAMTHRAAAVQPADVALQPERPAADTPLQPQGSLAVLRARALALRYYAMAGAFPAAWL